MNRRWVHAPGISLRPLPPIRNGVRSSSRPETPVSFRRPVRPGSARERRQEGLDVRRFHRSSRPGRRWPRLRTPTTPGFCCRRPPARCPGRRRRHASGTRHRTARDDAARFREPDVTFRHVLVDEILQDLELVPHSLHVLLFLPRQRRGHPEKFVELQRRIRPSEFLEIAREIDSEETRKQLEVDVPGRFRPVCRQVRHHHSRSVVQHPNAVASIIREGLQRIHTESDRPPHSNLRPMLRKPPVARPPRPGGREHPSRHEEIAPGTHSLKPSR